MNHEELLQLIDRAEREGWVRLNLPNQGLKEIPDEIEYLTKLQKLNLSNNQLTTLPESLGQLTKLQKLNISENALIALPESLGWFTELQTLNICKNRLTILPESLCRLTKLKNLDISENALITMPESLGQLTKLQNLNLSKNQLTILPESLGQLAKLQNLNICNNQLTILPESLGGLIELQNLDISENCLKILPESLNQLTQLQKLNLSSNQLTALPESLCRLAKLKNLALGDNQLSVLPESLNHLIELQSLGITWNQLITLPESLGQLTGLKSLNIRGNKLSTFPESLSKLTGLQNLNISENQLTTLPESLGQLVNLQQLDIHGNQLTSLPKTLGKLTKLYKLDIRGNQLISLPESSGQLTKLQKLNIYGNRLTSLPESLNKLIELQSLDIGENPLTNLPEWLGQLTKLQNLSIYGNQLTTLPESLGQLTKLQSLSIYGNQLTILSESLSRLVGLQRLDIGRNQLTNLPEWLKQFTELQTLDLNENQLTTLPEWLEQFSQLKYLDIRENPLPLPPEILERWNEPQVIIQAWNDSVTGQKQSLNEIKLVLVGQGNVGKTSLVNRLVHNTFNPHENKTEGIAVCRWPLSLMRSEGESKIQVNIWDFGGQEIMNATHQFFLTKRTIYLLVIDARQSEADNRLDYWLKIIHSFGGDSPILLIGNKCDQHPLDLDTHSLKLNYPQIRDILETSCKNRHGIQKLRDTLIEQITALPHVFDPLPVTWLKIKKQLETLEVDYISYDNYVERCQAAKVTNFESQEILLDFLHDLGIILHFPDPYLGMTNILNPAWVTEGIYKILNDKELFEKQGILTLDLLRRILDPQRYPNDKLAFIVELMEKFELCFPLEEKGSYLVPDLLPKAECDTGDWPQALAFQVHYNVLPGSIITRLIVRLYRLIQNHTVWRTGVLLECDGNEALVKADLAANRIYIWVRGPVQRRRELLAQIRGTLGSIHTTLSGLETEEMVPIPGHPKIDAVKYQWLRDMEEAGIATFMPPGMKTMVNVKDLLNGIEPPWDMGRLDKSLQNLDDVTLDHLCLVNSPEIYDQFGRGLRRDEKINLILDHCRRKPEAMDKIRKGLSR